MFRMIINLLLFYLAYRLVFDVIIPMFQGNPAKNVGGGSRDSVRGNSDRARVFIHPDVDKRPAASARSGEGDYIEFEEISKK
jgi:hypothetical protein